MKKILEDMILHWNDRGYTVDEIAKELPQVPRDAIAALVDNRHTLSLPKKRHHG